MGTAAAALLVVLFLPLSFYFYHSTSPLAWGWIEDRTVRRRASVYRDRREPSQIVWIEGHAPWVVRIAAFTSFCLGQLVIPLIPATPFLAVMTVSGWIDGDRAYALLGWTLSMPTAILVTAEILGAGIGLLQRAPHAASRARQAARWELCHNLAAGVFSVAFLGLGNLTGTEKIGYALLAASTIVGILHAGLLVAAARALDAYDVAGEAAEPARRAA